MKKRYMLMAACAMSLTLVSCSSNDEPDAPQKETADFYKGWEYLAHEDMTPESVGVFYDAPRLEVSFDGVKGYVEQEVNENSTCYFPSFGGSFTVDESNREELNAWRVAAIRLYQNGEVISIDDSEGLNGIGVRGLNTRSRYEQELQLAPNADDKAKIYEVNVEIFPKCSKNLTEPVKLTYLWYQLPEGTKVDALYRGSISYQDFQDFCITDEGHEFRHNLWAMLSK